MPDGKDRATQVDSSFVESHSARVADRTLAWARRVVTDRQTPDRQTDGQTMSQPDGRTGRQTDNRTNRQTDGQTDGGGLIHGYQTDGDKVRQTATDRVKLGLRQPDADRQTD